MFRVYIHSVEGLEVVQILPVRVLAEREGRNAWRKLRVAVSGIHALSLVEQRYYIAEY
jgi:hypothetical protein